MPTLILHSAGIKTAGFWETAKPGSSDLLLDCRIVRDPSHVGLGHDEAAQRWMEQESFVALAYLFSSLIEGIKMIPHRRGEQKDPYATPFRVLCFCAHGMHRSVAVKHILARWFQQEKSMEWEVKVE